MERKGTKNLKSNLVRYLAQPSVPLSNHYPHVPFRKSQKRQHKYLQCHPGRASGLATAMATTTATTTNENNRSYVRQQQRKKQLWQQRQRRQLQQKKQWQQKLQRQGNYR